MRSGHFPASSFVSFAGGVSAGGEDRFPPLFALFNFSFHLVLLAAAEEKSVRSGHFRRGPLDPAREEFQPDVWIVSPRFFAPYYLQFVAISPIPIACVHIRPDRYVDLAPISGVSFAAVWYAGCVDYWVAC